MAISIRDPATDAAIRRLAALTGESLTDAIRHAVEAEYSRRKAAVPLADRIAPLQDRFAVLPRTGAWADKAFFDDLSGEA